MVDALWRDAALRDRFAALDQWLAAHQSFWRSRAFQHLRLPWEAEYPELARQLRALTPQQVDTLAQDAALLSAWLEPFVPQARLGETLCAVPAHGIAQRYETLAEPYAVPGRKWRQSVRLMECLPASDLPVLEWCSGKAHLGRTLAREQGRRVEALEWNTALVEDGNRLSRREQLPVRVFCVDVLDKAALDFVRAEQEVIALHACGELHLQLLRGCGERHPRALALVPCCYHLIPSESYRPLSNEVRARGLLLSRDDLRTAMQESVTAPERERQRRRRLQAWRLGFDLLQREWRGIDEYLPTPSLPLTALHEGFAAFCARMAGHVGIEAPARVDYARYEALGEARVHEVAALDLVRLLFRRPLELWLVLDRALFLVERNYTVELGVFCERSLTPRNLLIRARYQG